MSRDVCESKNMEKQFFEDFGAAVNLWRSHELVLAGLAVAFQTTFAMVAVTRPTTGGGFSQYNLYKFVPANIDYFEKIPPLPVGLPAPCARPGVLYHFSSHYQVTDKTCFFYFFTPVPGCCFWSLGLEACNLC